VGPGEPLTGAEVCSAKPLHNHSYLSLLKRARGAFEGRWPHPSRRSVTLKQPPMHGSLAVSAGLDRCLRTN